MSIWDGVVIALIAGWLMIALRKMRKRKKSGCAGCCNGCGGCANRPKDDKKT
ncbi:MAG: FeoB-associated Cys-rich membrane protein [Clostridia bacterium]